MVFQTGRPDAKSDGSIRRLNLQGKGLRQVRVWGRLSASHGDDDHFAQNDCAREGEIGRAAPEPNGDGMGCVSWAMFRLRAYDRSRPPY